MDIVIPLGKGSKHDNIELRYTLRGIEMYVEDVENIFIIGEKPDFLQDIIQIPATDILERHYKQRNICRKLLLACEDSRVSDSFVWFSDDHFLLKPFIPDYNYHSTLRDSIVKWNFVSQTYSQTLLNTFDALMGEGLDYGHGPMILKKEAFICSMSFVNWNTPWGFAIKSLYCGLNKIPGKYYPDTKIKQPLPIENILRLIDGRPYFSLDDRGLNEDMWQVLGILFPKKSIYEKD